MNVDVPNYQELIFRMMSVTADFVQMALGDASSFATAKSVDSEDEYDAEAGGWRGEEGLIYRVPLMDVPSGLHARVKMRNIKILMNNVRELCMRNELPSTAEEHRFWLQYRYLKWQFFVYPFLCLLPPVYFGARWAQNKLPRYLIGRFIPIAFAGALAEQWADHTYPGQQLLCRAITARTPLGDAARAEWQRLQPVTIPLSTFTLYQAGQMLRDPKPGFGFGENIAEALTS